MIRLAIILVSGIIATASLATGTDTAPEPFQDFYSSRTVLGSIVFKSASETLSAPSKKRIDALVPALKKIDFEKRLLRVEGFCAPAEIDTDGTNLSMNRAKAVQLYLLQQHGFPQEKIFLTGFTRDQQYTSTKNARVDITVYDDLFEMDSAPVGALVLGQSKKRDIQ